MKKEKNKKIIKILCAVLLLMSLGMTGYTYAKYVTQEKGNGSADIATWSFRIEKDENGIYKENNTNSIKVYLKVKSSDSKMEMERLMLNDKAGVEKVEYAFSDLIFEMTNVEYHQKTGQVKSITFEEKENN